MVANDYNLFGHSGETNAQAFDNFTPGVNDTEHDQRWRRHQHPCGYGARCDSLIRRSATTAVRHSPTTSSWAVRQLIKRQNQDVAAINGINQRNTARNVNLNNGPATNLCDIGAVELQTTTAVDVSTVTTRLGTAGHIVTHWRTLSESQIAGFDVYRQVIRVKQSQVEAKQPRAAPSGQCGESARGQRLLISRTKPSDCTRRIATRFSFTISTDIQSGRMWSRSRHRNLKRRNTKANTTPTRCGAAGGFSLLSELQISRIMAL